MENFVAYNPTQVHFGRGVWEAAGETCREYGQKLLLVYGKGSVVKHGYYDKIKSRLEASGLQIVEYSGIKPNPVIEDVDRAVALGREEKVDLVVALGGGSVIDSAKIIALCIPGGYKGWDVMTRKVDPSEALPLVAILTLAATASEMNAVAVLQNHETQQKIGLRHPLNFPRHSFLDPEFTFSVPRNYTAYGIADLVAHALENYFGKGEATLSDRFIFSIIAEAMENGPALLEDLHHYELRARIMWAATNALNGLTLYGRANGDFAVHAIGHVLSLLYDTPHGASLTIAYPAWMERIKERDPQRIARLGKQLWGVTNAEQTIDRLKSFFRTLECPVQLSEMGIGQDKKQEILKLLNRNRVTGNHYPLSEQDRSFILDAMM